MSNESSADFEEHTRSISESHDMVALRFLEAQADEMEQGNAQRFKFAYSVMVLLGAWFIAVGTLVGLSGTSILTIDYRVTLVMSGSVGANVLTFVLLVGRYLFRSTSRDVSPSGTSP